MSQSVLNRYPVSRSCCHCISLKAGTIFIGVSGLLPSALLVLLYEAGTAPFEQEGVGTRLADTILHIYAVIGVLLGAVHIILIVAAKTYNEKLVLLYLWTCIFYIFIDIILVLCVAISAIIVHKYNFVVAYVICQLIYWLFIVAVVLPIVNGFRQSIHTVVIMITYAFVSF